MLWYSFLNMKFFLPSQPVFFELLLDVCANLKKIAALFAELAANFSDFEEYSRRAKEIEHEGDKKTHEIIDKLNKTFITPFDREDIYLLAHQLDDIIDEIENVIRDIHLYKITKKISAIEEFAALIVVTADHLEVMLKALQKQKNTPELVSAKIKIHELEDQGDAIFNKATAQLFNDENDPILLMKYKDIIEGLEEVMDESQKVSDVIEGIVVKSG